MKSPDIALIYNEDLSKDLFEGFELSLRNKQLKLTVESKPKNGPYLCAEWFIPTVVVAYIAKSYFNGFLNEMGKDHYLTLKEQLSGVASNVMSKPRIEPTIIGTEGKISKNNPYSLAFSICAEASDGNKFKLLVPKPSEAEDYTIIVYKFLEFLNDFHSGVKIIEDTGYDLSIKPPSGHVFLHLNQKTQAIEWLDERLYR